jgi:serine/threonine-protein kinase
VKFCKTCGELFEDDAIEACPEDGTVLKAIHEKSTDEDPMLGQLVDGRFRVVSALGKGGFGAVYRAVQTSVGREIAIKFILEGMPPEGVRRFMREAKATSALRNVHTVTIFDFGQNDDGKLYLAMEMLEGQTLRQRLNLMGQVPWKQALHIISQIAESLEEAHSLGMIHRDLKPGNIMLTEMGGDQNYVKVLDFGIAKFQDQNQSQITHTGSTLGSPSYMSPEQARGGDLTAASDIYSCGIMLYEMLCGRVPFVADQPVQVLFQHCSEALPDMAEVNPNVEIPPEVDALVARLLEKKPENRPGSALAAKQIIQALLVGESSEDLTQVVPSYGTQSHVSLTPGPVSGMEQTVAVAPTPGPGALYAIGDSDQARALAMVGGDGHEDTGHLQQISADLPSLQKKSKAPMVLAAALLLGLGAYAMNSSVGDPATSGGKAEIDVAKQAVVPAKESGPSAKPKPAVETAPAPEPATRVATLAPVAKVPDPPKTLRLITTPPGAEVLDSENTALGKTPLELPVTGNDRIFSFRLAGFKHMDKVVVSGKKQGDLGFELEAKPAPKPAAKRRVKRRPQKPAAKPAPPPAPAKKKKKGRRSERELF